jgi:exodeoxyribonuclease X
MPPRRAAPDAYVTACILVELFEVATIDQMIACTTEPKFTPAIPFGKRRGLRWAEAPEDYLQWMVRQTDMDQDTVWWAREELERRSVNA